jgi:large subunit ribosomal protein L44
LTHPSFTTSSTDISGETTTEDADLTQLAEETTETNEILSSLGNSLLGLFASEHLSSQFPYLPTAALKQAVTAFVGPKACMSVARELGLGTQNKVDGNFNGVGVRWRKPDVEVERESTPIAQRFLKYQGEKGHRRHEKHDNFEDVVAGVVKAFVGLIYRERVSTFPPFPSCTLPIPHLFYVILSRELIDRVFTRLENSHMLISCRDTLT